MQQLNAGGAKLDAISFIKYYDMATKVSPPRYLTLVVCDAVAKAINVMAAPPKAIQWGDTPGPMGKRITRICCITPPRGVQQGIALKVDPAIPVGRLVFEIHGIPELVIDNLTL